MIDHIRIYYVVFILFAATTMFVTKTVLFKKGFKLNVLNNPIREFRNLISLIRNTEDAKEKRLYHIVLSLNIIMVLGLIEFFIITFKAYL